MIRLHLSEEERRELNCRLGDRRMTLDGRGRLDMIRLSDWGLSAPTIAGRVSRHENTVRKLLKRFQKERFAALPKHTPPGRPPRLREEHFRALEALLDGSARTFTSGQMVAWMQGQLGLTVPRATWPSA
jgi:transposase